jgi:uncharacterized SAM-binding protein YcdF (DUF218 family)
MNDIFLSLGIASWKNVATAFVLPPFPLLLLILLGARLMFRRRLLAWLMVLLGCSGLWLMACEGTGILLTQWLLKPPPALTPQQVTEIKRSPKTAIVVLGGGRRVYAPEYGTSTLHWRSLERLRYGIWLSRESGAPVAYSGGIGWGGNGGQTEADSAARVAERDFGRPLRWLENTSRDTRENALKTVALLRPQGIEHIVVVTNDYHMPRALANFERAQVQAATQPTTQATAQAATPAGAAARLRVTAAPMGQSSNTHVQGVDFLPSVRGYDKTWVVLHELLGNLIGA